MTEYDDVEVERRVRASLDNHAGEVDTSVPVAARARAAARRHRGRRIAAGAAVAVAAVAVTAVVVDRADPPSSEPPPAASPSPSQAAMPDGWRTEYWHDVSVQVPADWGWGAGPFRQGGSTLRCGGPDPGTAYVGRPILQSDLCWRFRHLPPPTAPYVWLDAPIEPGAVDLSNGYVQETAEVDGTTVTVGSDDEALRARILASVARQELCPADVDPSGLDIGDMNLDGLGQLKSAHVCAYSRLNDDDHRLVYGRELDAERFAWLDRAIDRAPEDLTRCKGAGDLVVVTATFDDHATQSWVADLACDTLASSLGMRSITLNVISELVDQGLRVSLPELIGPQG